MDNFRSGERPLVSEANSKLLELRVLELEAEVSLLRELLKSEPAHGEPLIDGRPVPVSLIKESPIHLWFELSYAQFLTVPRIFLQSMPHWWQRRLVNLLNGLDSAFDWRPKQGQWWVVLRDSRGRFHPLSDEICNYRRGSVDHLMRDDVVGFNDARTT